MGWLDSIADAVDRHGVVARVILIAAHGPSPRGVGTSMLVTASRRYGKIGRTALENVAVARARDLIRASHFSSGASWLRSLHTFATGPVLGEPSHGALMFLVEVFGKPEIEALSAAATGPSATGVVARPLRPHHTALILHPADRLPGQDKTLQQLMQPIAHPPGQTHALVGPFADGETLWLLEPIAPAHTPLFVYGTGLIAQALVHALVNVPFDITWVDNDPRRFATPPPRLVAPLVVQDPAQAAGQAPAGAYHAVMTQSHDLDYAICRALLVADRFAFAGVLGSHLKRDRLCRKLSLDGISQPALARLVCPLGMPGIKSKTPAVIAIAIAAQLLVELHRGPPPRGGGPGIVG